MAYKLCVCVLSHVQLFETPWTVACQDPLRDLWDFSGKNTRVAQGYTSPDLPITRGLCFLPQHGDNPGFALFGKAALSTEFKSYFTGRSIP